MKKWRTCRRGESPRPKKSGYNAADRRRMAKGDVRFNKKKGVWEIREDTE